MTTAKTSSAAGDGYWTIQIIGGDGVEAGRRFVCHAHDEAQAQTIAGHLAGAGREVKGFDYHRIDNPVGRYQLALAVGQSERVHDMAAWAVFEAARRSA